MSVSQKSLPIKISQKDKPLENYFFFLSRNIESHTLHVLENFIIRYGGKLLPFLKNVQEIPNSYFISSKLSKMLNRIQSYVPKAVFQLAFDSKCELEHFKYGVY
jgi:hypothetical protein